MLITYCDRSGRLRTDDLRDWGPASSLWNFFHPKRDNAKNQGLLLDERLLPDASDRLDDNKWNTFACSIVLTVQQVKKEWIRHSAVLVYIIAGEKKFTFFGTRGISQPKRRKKNSLAFAVTGNGTIVCLGKRCSSAWNRLLPKGKGEEGKSQH